MEHLGCGMLEVLPLPRPKMPKSSIADFGMWDESFFASAQSLLSENLGGSFPWWHWTAALLCGWMSKICLSSSHQTCQHGKSPICIFVDDFPVETSSGGFPRFEHRRVYQFYLLVRGRLFVDVTLQFQVEYCRVIRVNHVAALSLWCSWE